MFEKLAYCGVISASARAVVPLSVLEVVGGADGVDEALREVSGQIVAVSLLSQCFTRLSLPPAEGEDDLLAEAFAPASLATLSPTAAVHRGWLFANLHRAAPLSSESVGANQTLAFVCSLFSSPVKIFGAYCFYSLFFNAWMTYGSFDCLTTVDFSYYHQTHKQINI